MKNQKYTYFIQADVVGHIKIGSSTDVEGRLEALSTASPVKLTLLCFVSADTASEPDLHALFKATRLHHEWFASSKELLALISLYQMGVAVPLKRNRALERALKNVKAYRKRELDAVLAVLSDYDERDVARTRVALDQAEERLLREVFPLREQEPFAEICKLSAPQDIKQKVVPEPPWRVVLKEQGKRRRLLRAGGLV